MSDLKMTDAISRSAVLTIINGRSYDTAYPSERDELVIEINKIPALDAVPVVRCKDCRKRGSYPCPMFLIAHDCTEDDGFCHLGERWECEEDAAD